MHEDLRRTIVVADQIKKAPAKLQPAGFDDTIDMDKPRYLNVAKVSGSTARTYQYFPPRAGKQAVGNLLIRVGQQLIQGKLFNYLASKFNDRCPAGSEVLIQGRLNYREAEGTDDTGNPMNMIFTEIIGDAGVTKVITEAVPDDPFAGTPAEAVPVDVDDESIPF
jgi:hypothetical protein